MPIFDRELGDNVSNRNYKQLEAPHADLPGPSFETYKPLDISSLDKPNINQGISLKDVRNFTAGFVPMGPNSPFQMISSAELAANKRYPMYERGLDLENVYGLGQGFWSQIGNGFAKAGIRAAGAFAQSFYTIPDDIAAIKNGDFNRLLGGEDMKAMDEFTKNAEELFPNYYTRYEKEHPYTGGFGNFIGDKIVSNLGYTVGTIGASIVQNAIIDAAISAIPSGGAGAVPGAIVGAGTGLLRGIGKASLVLSKIFSGTNKLEKVLDTALEVGRAGEQVLNLKKLVELNAGRNALVKAFDNTRYGLTMWNAAQSEANVEGRQGVVQIREALINEYKNTHYGQSPTGIDLKNIEDQANAGGLAIMAGNMPLLLVSNAVQFDGILKSFSKAAMDSKIISTQLGKLAIKEGTVDEVEKVVAKDIYGKIWNAVKTPAKNILTEGVYEEGGQYAVSQGVADYYTNKYKNKDSASIINSAIKGLSDQFTTSEGIENMVIGGITGGLFGIVEHAVERRFGKTDAKLNTIISELNNSKISGSFAEKYDNTARSVEIAKQMQDAAKSNDIRKYKNLKADLFFTKVMQRINMGMHDVTIEQLEMMRDLPKDQFENMFGVDFNTSNKQTVDEYVDKLISTANEIKQTSESVDNAFRNPFTYIQNPKSKEEESNNRKYNIFEHWKLDIKNFSFSKQDRNNRLNDIQSELIKLNPLLNNALVGSLLNNNQLKSLADSYSEDASIKEEGLGAIPSNERAQVRSDIKKLRTISEKINMALSSGVVDPKLFEELVNLEINNRDFSKPGDITFDKIEKLMSYSSDIDEINKEKSRINDYIDVLTSEGGFKKYFEDKEKEQKEIEEEVQDVEVVDETKPLTHIFKNHEGNEEQVEVGREYETTKVKLVKPKKEGSKYKVIAPNGKTTYFDTRKEALTHAKEINSDISDLAKVKVLALNEDGTVKVEDINGNIQNINLLELEGYKSLQTQQERLAKEKEVIEQEQNKIEIVSGDIETVSNESTQTEESKLKDASYLFKAGISESEDWNDPNSSAPHIKRTRLFLNNVARFKNRKNYKVILITPTNAKNAGLEGIVELSYKNNIGDIDTADVYNGFMAQVFIYTDKSGSYFVNEKGEKIGKVGEQIPDIKTSGIVFQTMPAAKLEDSKNNPRFRKEQEEQAKKELAAYKIFREQKFKDDSIGQAYPFRVSRGIRRKTEVKESNYIQDILGVDGKKIVSSDSGLLEVVTTGKVNFNGVLLNFPKGTIVFKSGDTIDFANNKKLTPSQALNVFSVIEALANKIINDSERGDKVSISGPYATFLQNILYWKSKADTKSTSQIGIDTNTMSLKIGNKSFELSTISENKTKIIDALSDAFLTVNNKTLAKGVTQKFIEYVANPNGEPIAVTWNSYQEYLLSDKTPDNKTRSVEETPLISRAPKPTDLFPSSYVQRYSIIEEGTLEFPYHLVKEEVKEEAPKNVEKRKYNLQPGAVNGFKLSDGRDILFTGEKTDGKYIITIQKNKTLDDLVADANVVNSVRSNLESIGISTSKMNSAQVINEFLQLSIIQDIERQSAQPAVEETSGTFTPTTPYGTPTGPELTTAPVSNIEAKKADIERRRQEELETETNGLETARKGDKGIFWTQFKGLRQDYETDKEVEVQAVSKYGVKFKEHKNWTNFEKYYYFKNITKEQEINDKYDAELATLEGTKPTEETEAPVDLSKIKRGRKGGNFRIVSIGDQPKMTESDIQEFKKWHAKNLPNIPFEILEKLINTLDGRKAWGVFEDGVAKFVRGGLKGTEYHEVFEGVWANLLTDTEKQEILDELRASDKSFIDRETKKEYQYATAPENVIKERIADDFADYRLGKIKTNTLIGKIKTFFQRIIDFVKAFVGKKTTVAKSKVEELFDKINEGKLKDRVNIGKSNLAPQYRSVEGLTEEQTNDFVNDVIGQVSKIIFGEEKYRKELLFSPNNISGKGIFQSIREQYIENGILESIGEKRWEAIQQRSIEKLRTLGASFDFENDINNEESNSRDYAPEAFSVDWKQSSSSALRFMLATIPLRLQYNQRGSTSLSFPIGNEENNGFNLSDSIGGYQIADFSRIFATLLDKLSNTTSIQDFMNKLIELAETDTTYLSVFSRLGGDLGTKSFNFNKNNFSGTDWRLFVQFYNLFSKQKPEALIQFISNGDRYIGNANLFTASKNIVKVWTNSIKKLSGAPDSIISYDSNRKMYVIDSNAVKNIPITLSSDRVAFLQKIGIDFPMDVYLALSDDVKIVNGKKTSQQIKFTDAVSSIHEYLGKKPELMTIKENTLDISGPLRTLSELYIAATNPIQESTYSGIEGQQIGVFAENNASSLFENDFNESDTLDELLAKRPELNGYYSEHSELLKPGGLFFDNDGNRISELHILKIDGTKDIDNGKDIPISKLTLGQRYTQEINQNIKGNYYVLVPGDGSTEWMMNMGNIISYEEIESGEYKKRVHEIFKNYLLDEAKLALFGESKSLAVKSKSKELRFFKEILNNNDVIGIESLLKNKNTTLEQVEEYINKNIDTINSAIDKFISDVNDRTFETLSSSSQIFQIGEDKYSLNKFDSEFINKYKLENASKEQVDNFLNFININYIINNTEFHKVLFGDPYQFEIKKNGNLDETKRIKLFLSPAARLFDLKEYNDFLTDNYNKVGEEYLHPEHDKYTYHTFKDHVKTATLEDVTIFGSIAMSELPDPIKEKYAEVNETDAMSWIGDNTYKEVKLKLGKWSDQAEEWHQWQMAYTRKQLAKKGLYKYNNPKLEKLDLERTAKDAPPHHIEVIKPIVRGSKYGKTDIDNVLDKFSQMPLYYSMVEGTNMEELYLKMKDENIGYVIVKSGRKVGSEGNNKIYNEDGSFNTKEYTNTIDVAWKTYGLIVETSSEGEKQQTRGSQITKIISGDLQENGKFISKEAEDAYNENRDALEALNEYNYRNFLDKLGIREEDGVFYNENNERVSETIMYEILRRDVSENVKDSIKLNKEKQFLIPFEASPSYESIKNIIYSIVNKSLVQPKMNGAPHVQAPSTMFESGNRKLARKVNGKWQEVTKLQFDKLSPEEKNSVVITDNTLKFYTKEEPWCEVMLPAWFKNKFIGSKFKTDDELIEYLNTKEGQKILSGIAFRIPTQSLASVERFRVKAFLPSYMGYTVIVPSEITTKAGSDFDIDKLNMYLKSIYIDGSGQIRLVEYKGSEKETMDFYRNVYDRVSKKEEFTKSNIIEAIDIELNDMDDPKGLVNIYGDYIQSMKEKFSNIMDLRDELERQLVEKTDEEFYSELRENYAKEKYKQALENRYYESLEKLLDVHGIERILSPVSDAGLEKLSIELDELRGYNESSIKGRLLDRSYMTSLRHDFITGKAWVGIAAVNITGLTIRQKGEIYLDVEKLKLLSKYDQGFIKDLNFVVPTNKINVNGKTYVSLSGLKTADGTNQYLSDRFSGYATSFVDIAANPFISKIIKHNSIVSTFMFLEAVGAGETGVMFLNQPIIDEYLKILDKKNTKSLKNNKNIEAVKALFPTTTAVDNKTNISISDLKNNIKEYYTSDKKLSNEKNAQQQLILDEFIKYSVLAEQLFKFNQATNYDTTRVTSGDTLFKKNVLLNKVRNRSVIANVDQVLNNTFIGKLRELLNNSNDAIGTILKFESPEIRQYINDVLFRYADRQFISNDTYEKIGNLIKNAFLDYCIQTKSTLNQEIKSLLVDEATSITTQLEELKNKYPSVKILQQFESVYGERENSAKTIKLKVNPKGDVYSENIYIEMMRELRDTNDELNKFYNNIITVSILQGSSNSAINFRNIIPVEDYSKIISPIINQLKAGPALENFTDSMFERNNFKNPDIFTNFTPRRIFGNSLYGNNFNITGFSGIKGLVLGSERKVLQLSELYNPLEVQSDFITIPRIFRTTLSTPEGSHQIWIDMKTGNRLSKTDFDKFKETGDTSIKDKYYYKKVYTDEYNEFGEKLPLRVWVRGSERSPGYHTQVYKLVNVYGDSFRASEYPSVNLPSVIDNESIDIKKEIEDKDIINALKPALPTQEEKLAEQTNNEQQSNESNISNEQNGKPNYSILDQRQNKLQYTPNQEKALLDIQNLIDSNKKGYYLLAGYAGTGKTTIVENIANYANLKNKKVVVMAPTNKAVRVLESKLKDTKNINVSTLHKLLYGAPDEITGEWKPAQVFTNSVVIIDESSMVNKELMKDLIDATNVSNNSVIFIGDGFQLEQIGESSKLFESLNNNKLFKQTYNEDMNGSVTLTEVKRQALDNDILKLATAIRKDNKAYIPTESTEDVKVMKDKQMFINDFRESVKNNEDSIMIVATNNERILMNKVARLAKFQDESKNILNKYDKLISIANSDSISNSEIVTLNNFDNLEKHTISLKSGDTFNDYDVYFTNATFENGETKPMLFFPGMDRPSVYHGQIMQDVSGSLYTSLIEKGLIYLDKRNKEKLIDNVIVSTYGYAVTAHKSQGSQWEKVFVNQNYIAPSWNGARWFYTAVTRASDKLEIYDSGKNTPISNLEINNKITSEISEESKKNSVSLPSDQEILDSVDFKKFAMSELEKNPNLTIEQILEHFKKCGNG